MLHRLTNARIFAPEDLGVCELLVAAGKIVALGKKLPEIADDLLSSDTNCGGKFLIPGLIDGHAHITGGGGEAGFKTRVPALNLSQYTRAGVTTVIGLLGTDDTTRSTSALIAQVYALREQGLSAWCYTGGYHIPLTTFSGSVRDDIVHIEPLIGVGELALSDHRSSQPTFDEICRIAGDCHVAGLMTGKAGIVHFHLGDGKRGLALLEQILQTTEIPARVLNPTHCNRQKDLFDQACELTSQGCSIDITTFPASDSKDEYSAAEAFRLYRDRSLDMSKLTISSDGGGCLPQFDAQGELTHLDYGRCSLLSETLKALLDEGFSPAEVAPVFSSNVADLLRLHQKGRIAVGRDADLLLLDAKHNIEAVMARGQWHQKNYKTIKFGGFEAE